EQVEGLFFGKRLFESLLPLAFKIDGVDQEHDLLRVYFIYDLADLALGAGADPAVDCRRRLRAVEIERGDFGAVELPVARQEILVESHASARPQRIGDGQLDLRIRAFQRLQQIGARAVEFGQFGRASFRGRVWVWVVCGSL